MFFKKGSKKQVRKPVSQNFEPKRLAINFNPPCLIMEYLVIDTGKLYHHKMRLDSILKKENVQFNEVVDYIKNKHSLYFIKGTIKDRQLITMVERIMSKMGLIKKKDKNNTGKQVSALEKQCINYVEDDQDYAEDYEDYEDQSKKGEKKETFMTYCQEDAEWDLDMDQNADFV